MAQQSSPPHPRLLRTGDRFGVRRRLIVGAAVAALALGALAGAAGARDSGLNRHPRRAERSSCSGRATSSTSTPSAPITRSEPARAQRSRGSSCRIANAPTFLGSIKLVPDIAAAVPTKGNGISADGKTYTFKLRPGVKWNTTPARAGHGRRFRARVQDALQPGRAERRARLLHEHDRRHEGVLRRLREGQGDGRGDRRLRQRRTRSPASSRQDPSTLMFKLVNPAPDFLEHPRDGLLLGPAGRVHDSTSPTARRCASTCSRTGRTRSRSTCRASRFTLERNPAWKQAADPLRHAYVDHIDDHRGAELGQRPAADRGGHGRHGVGHPAAGPGSAAADLGRGQAPDPRPFRAVRRRAPATTSR